MIFLNYRYNFINLTHHKEDFDIHAEWHFHATSHGKGPCDGIGGTLKRGASRASLARKSGEEITNAQELYNWAMNFNTIINFCFTDKNDYESMKEKLHLRMLRAVTIKGTMGLHSFKPLTKDYIETRKYSNSEYPSKNKISKTLKNKQF